MVVMDACDLVRLVVNRVVMPPEPRRRGNPGYPRLRAVRLLVYSKLARLENDTWIVRHLKRRRDVVRALGFRRVPHRTTVGRWWRRYSSLLERVFNWLSGLIQLLAPTRLLVVDSTPLVDLRDMEADWGFTGRGAFRGFKLHVAVNQLGLPLKTVVTAGNRHDAPLLPALLEDLEAEYVLADAGYDSKGNREAVRSIGAEPVIAVNPRRGAKRRPKHGRLLKAKRYLVEQFNSLVKGPVLRGSWIRPRGLVKKTSVVTAGLIGLNMTAAEAMLGDEPGLKAVSRHWL